MVIFGKQTTVSRLHEAILAVCPIEGVAIVDPADHKTWRIDFKPGATAEQMTAAQEIVAGFDPSAPTVPSLILAWKARAKLADMGLLTSAQQAVEASANLAIKAAFEFAPEWHRASPAVNAMGAAIGLSTQQLDGLFIAADAVTA